MMQIENFISRQLKKARAFIDQEHDYFAMKRSSFLVWWTITWSVKLTPRPLYQCQFLDNKAEANIEKKNQFFFQKIIDRSLQKKDLDILHLSEENYEKL